MPAPYTGGSNAAPCVTYDVGTNTPGCPATAENASSNTRSAYGMSMPVKKDRLTVTGPDEAIQAYGRQWQGNEVPGGSAPSAGVRIYHVMKSAKDVVSIKHRHS